MESCPSARASSPGARNVCPGKFRAARIAASMVAATAIGILGGIVASCRWVAENTAVDSSTISTHGEKDRANAPASGAWMQTYMLARVLEEFKGSLAGEHRLLAF